MSRFEDLPRDENVVWAFGKEPTPAEDNSIQRAVRSRKGVVVGAAAVAVLAAGGSVFVARQLAAQNEDNEAQPPCDLVVESYGRGAVNSSIAGIQEHLASEGDEWTGPIVVTEGGPGTPVVAGLRLPTQVQIGHHVTVDHVRPDACEQAGGEVVEEMPAQPTQ